MKERLTDKKRKRKGEKETKIGRKKEIETERGEKEQKKKEKGKMQERERLQEHKCIWVVIFSTLLYLQGI